MNQVDPKWFFVPLPPLTQPIDAGRIQLEQATAIRVRAKHWWQRALEYVGLRRKVWEVTYQFVAMPEFKIVPKEESE